MRFSCFAPLSLYKLSAKEPDSKAIYRSLLAGLGDQYDLTLGGRMEATCFAQALGLARVRKRLRQAANQRLPERVVDLIERREAELGITPGPNDTLADRRAVLVERFKLPSGASSKAISAALGSVLGADLVAYIPTPVAGAAVSPSNIGDAPMNLQRPEVPRKIVRLVDSVAFISQSVTVRFDIVGGTDPPVEGDVLVFDPGEEGQADRVTLSAVGRVASSLEITATFARPHEAGTLGFTHPFPCWRSTRRESIVVVSPAAAQDPEKRRRINDEMRRHARSVSVWSIVAAAGSVTQQFALGTPCMGYSTLKPIAV